MELADRFLIHWSRFTACMVDKISAVKVAKALIIVFYGVMLVKIIDFFVRVLLFNFGKFIVTNLPKRVGVRTL